MEVRRLLWRFKNLIDGTALAQDLAWELSLLLLRHLLFLSHQPPGLHRTDDVSVLAPAQGEGLAWSLGLQRWFRAGKSAVAGATEDSHVAESPP